MSGHYTPKSAFSRFVHEFEETFIAIILGLMTIITFINVILRYGFNTGLIWGLEATAFLFAWLVLFGMSYAVKVTAHLGVDAVLNAVPSRVRRIMGLITVAICIAYAFLLLKGAWDYWAPFAGFDATTGRWFPTGFANSRDQAWYEVGDIYMVDWLRFIEPIFNAGEAYEKLPRFIPYVMLPIGAALLFFRVLQASWRLISGQQDSLIVSHEAEDAVEDVRHHNAED
ncbi:TRAP transporter small permease [Thalassobius sp. Cn5-15]|uniref:TRAP transporter small permease n=1 Tax=Thalassobius sp. Cn5-15 TaxID=2917763 RepID=UPI001EF19BB2|nr:TRAP transporter small permease [Thalassobius sp. Cn5-15]MCG7491995.1 TRAP transporter small permease [Thalassobius sp. Cn5-15]